jgi:hypothetical protein
MIPCTDFIPAYSELFKFIHDRRDKAGVVAFWEYLSDQFLGNLRDEAARNGLRGCWNYWSHTLNEEAADFTMTLDEDAGEFRIEMHHCPSMGRLLDEDHIEPYPHYCEHCDTLYRRVLEPLGFDYELDLSRCHEAACTLIVRKKTDLNT